MSKYWDATEFVSQYMSISTEGIDNIIFKVLAPFGYEEDGIARFVCREAPFASLDRAVLIADYFDESLPEVLTSEIRTTESTPEFWDNLLFKSLELFYDEQAEQGNVSNVAQSIIDGYFYAVDHGLGLNVMSPHGGLNWGETYGSTSGDYDEGPTVTSAMSEVWLPPNVTISYVDEDGEMEYENYLPDSEPLITHVFHEQPSRDNDDDNEGFSNDLKAIAKDYEMESNI